MTSAQPWAAERTVDVPRAQELVAAVAPQLAATPVVPLSEGWDNTVFRVGDWTARFPRRTQALPGFRRELAVLPLVAGRLPLAVPVPRWIGTDDDPREPWPFAVVQHVPGRELAEIPPPAHERRAAAAALGAFLAVLHAPATAELVGGVELPVDPMQRALPAARLEQTRTRLAELSAAGLWSRDRAVEDLLAEGSHLSGPAAEPVLVHGDLHVRHLLLDDDGGATGVIDWGDVCRADPAVDLALAYAGFTGAARAALLDAYGGVDPERELRARCLAVRMSALLAGWAAADGRAGLLAESLAGLARAVN